MNANNTSGTQNSLRIVITRWMLHRVLQLSGQETKLVHSGLDFAFQVVSVSSHRPKDFVLGHRVFCDLVDDVVDLGSFTAVSTSPQDRCHTVEPNVFHRHCQLA
jgi:hypothetical protein